MKAVIYARYSSDNQREESIEGQLRECRAFAEKNDVQIIGTYIDRAYSAKTDNRPEFQRMIKESSGRTFDIILVWKLDRFARNRYDSAHYKAMLRRNGVRVVSATESISEGAEGILLESVLEGMAEYYSAELAEKVNRGMTENALKCKFNGGTPPLGYVIDKDQFYQIDPITAPIVLEAFQRYASGASMREVVDEMNLKGIRTNRGGKMNINRVTGMLHNRRYIGEFRYRDIVQPGGIPAIVPGELFNQVQERMAANKKAPARHKAEEEYLLTTKLFCGKCQCYMAGESGTGKNGTTHRYYKCVSVKHHRGCDKKSVRKGWIESAVIFMARKIIFDDDLIEDVAQTVEEELNTESTALAALRAQYDATQKSLDNLLLAIEQGILTPTTKHRMEQLEEEKKELSAQIAKEELSKPKLTKNQIIFWFHRLRKLDMSKVEHRRRLIDSFINAVFLFEDHMVFVFNFKGGTTTVTFEELEAAGFGSAFSGFAVPKQQASKRMPAVLDIMTRRKGLESSKNRNMPVAYCIPQCSHWGIPLFLPQAETQTSPFRRTKTADIQKDACCFWYYDPEEGTRIIQKPQYAGGILHSSVLTLGNSSVSATGRNANESLPAYHENGVFHSYLKNVLFYN